jgi:hypothetical protein
MEESQREPAFTLLKAGMAPLSSEQNTLNFAGLGPKNTEQ